MLPWLHPFKLCQGVCLRGIAVQGADHSNSLMPTYNPPLGLHRECRRGESWGLHTPLPSGCGVGVS